MRRITSTGGLLALGLSKPSPTESGAPELSALQMLELYEREGAAIFERDLWHRFMAIENVLEEKYPSNGIERVLSDYFGDTQLSEALTEVFVTSYDIERRTPFFFRRSRARERHGWDWLMRQAARATSAAPTFFEPARLQAEGSGADPLARRGRLRRRLVGHRRAHPPDPVRRRQGLGPREVGAADPGCGLRRGQ